MAEPSAASPSRFEQDLRAIREDRNVPLSEVQQETRIPVDVLERFESGRLISDPHFNEVYIKALVRSYATAIGLAPSEALAGYEAAQAGSYQGQLQTHLTSPPAQEERGRPAPPADEPPPRKASATASPQEPSAEEPPPTRSPSRKAAAAPPAVEALRQAPSRPAAEKAAPSPRSEPKTRVRSRAEASSTTTPIDRSWGIIIGGTLLGVLIIGGLLWFLLRGDDPQPIDRPRPVAEAPAEPGDPAAAEDDAFTAPAVDTPQLQTPIAVTVIAQDAPLQGFRVTEGDDSRRPYWIEQGDSQTFEDDNIVIIWGAQRGDGFGIPPTARLELQGYTWNPSDGTVLRIDRQRGQALLDSLHLAQRGTPPGQPATGGAQGTQAQGTQATAPAAP